MSDIRKLLESFDSMVKDDDDVILMGDQFDIELHENFIIETGVVGFMEDGIIVQGDDAMFEFLNLNGVLVEDVMTEEGELLDEQFKIRHGLALITFLAMMWGVDRHFAQQAYDASPQLQELMKHYAYAQQQGDQRMIDQLEDRIENHKFRLNLGKGDVMGDGGRPIEVIYDKEGKIKDIDENDELSDIKRLLPTVGKMSKDSVEINGKTVDVRSIEVDGVDTKDYPDLVDSYASYAEFEDGTPLSDEELDILQDRYRDIIYQAALDSLYEAKYQGRTVPLNKPMKGDVAKSKVYVKNAKGNVVKVNFGDKNMKIKKSNPKRRKSFRARHNCDNPGPKWKARYWSCRAW